MKQIIELLFNLRDVLHLTHLYPSNPAQLGSNAEHKALGKLYEDLSEKIDVLAESYQGCEGLISLTIGESKSTDKPIELLKAVANNLIHAQDGITESWVNNQLDEIVTLIYRTIYKLENLK